jgi:hypothetical protein
MSNEFSLRAYREAKTILPHLDAIITIFELSLKGLVIFKSYVPVYRVMVVIDEQKKLLESHRARLRKVLESKGRLSN